jgi:hypothetical protein
VVALGKLCVIVNVLEVMVQHESSWNQVMVQHESSWNLDWCVALLPAISELIKSGYELNLKS